MGAEGMTSEVVTWDCTTEGPAEPETWVQLLNPSVKVCGGAPNVVVLHESGLYRHTPNGFVWVLQQHNIGFGRLQNQPDLQTSPAAPPSEKGPS